MASGGLRVLHLGKYFPPVAGGIERFLDELSAAQVASGLAPTVLAHDRGPTRVEEGARVIVRARSYGECLFVPVSPAWPLTLQRILRQRRPQLIHIHLPNPWAFSLLLSPLARRIPWIVHWHADIPLDDHHRGLRLAYPLYAWPERALLRRAARVIATSPQYLQSSLPLQQVQQASEVVPLGMIDRPAPAGDAPDWPAPGLRLLTVGRLSYYKGFSVLLDALARAPEISLLMIGGGEQEPLLRERIATLGLGDRVRMLGKVDDTVIESAYQACDLLCLPSLNRAEAFGLVMLEAMRAGKPVVASAVPGSGMNLVVANEDSGLLTPPGDVDALATALTRLRDDAELRQRMGRRGRERFLQQFRIEPVAQAITTIYRRVLDQAETARPPTTP